MASANYSDITGRVIGHWSGGGGSQPLKKVTITVADIQADPFGDGTPGAPLMTVPADALFAALGYTVTTAFNDSGAAANPGSVRDATNVVDLGLASSVFLNSANSQVAPPWWDVNSWNWGGFSAGSYPTADAGAWLALPSWALDGDAGSVDFILYALAIT